MLAFVAGYSAPTFAKKGCTEVVFDKDGHPHPKKIPCPKEPKDPQPEPSPSPTPTPTEMKARANTTKCYLTETGKTKAETTKTAFRCPEKAEKKPK
jgi:hypothetical protein